MKNKEFKISRYLLVSAESVIFTDDIDIAFRFILGAFACKKEAVVIDADDQMKEIGRVIFIFGRWEISFKGRGV